MEQGSEPISVAVATARVLEGSGKVAFLRAQADACQRSRSGGDVFALAVELYHSEHEKVRMLAVILLGRVVASEPDALAFLRNRVAQDDAWRVQEMLAMAFDQYCKDVGYEEALPTIRDWLDDSHPNVRRAASEGLRVWTKRPYFAEHPDVAVELLSARRDDASPYVRKSIANALRDIEKQSR